VQPLLQISIRSEAYQSIIVRSLTDIVFVNVGVDQAQFGLVLRILDGCFDDLVHRGDTRSSSDHEQMGRQVFAVRESSV
jgi:hypothetical protein